VLFALQRFDEAAPALYAVLAVEPGWDWTTMIGLYPDVETYTRQLRALESYIAQSPKSAAARFVLAYHYLTQGHIEAAIGQLQEVTQLQPRDTIAAQLLRQLEKSEQPASTSAALASSAAPADATPTPAATPTDNPTPATPAHEGNLTGTWTAQPADGTTITVSFPDANRFVWTVARQGKTQVIQGARSAANGILTLAPDQTQGKQENQPLVGHVTWHDDNHFTFKLLGGPPDDPGLSFAKSA
jgi:hypothetical protein